MAWASKAAVTSDELCREAKEAWKQNRPNDALDLAWAAFDLAPGEDVTKALIARLLQAYPAKLSSDRRAAYLKLLVDPSIEPNLINPAGWHLVLRSCRLADAAGE